jgi:tetratricopeptide (TPR) repeat protein
MYNEAEDKARLIRQMSQEAINLAMYGRWQEAISVNLAIIENMPNDVDAYNRLGKAYMELSDYDRAMESYSRVLDLDSGNSIAQKNLVRISQLKASNVVMKEYHAKAAPHQFIGEAGKSGVVNLYNLGDSSVLAKMMAGDKVTLKSKGQQLAVENEEGEYLGQVEPQHALRLIKLLTGGNKYASAIVSIDDSKVRVIIREIYQSPDLLGLPSFPARPLEGFQPHVKDTLLRRRSAEEEEMLEEVDDSELFGEEGQDLIPEGFSILEEGISMDSDMGEDDLLEEED